MEKKSRRCCSSEKSSGIVSKLQHKKLSVWFRRQTQWHCSESHLQLCQIMKGILGCYSHCFWERAGFCCHVEVRWSPSGSSGAGTVAAVVQDQRGKFFPFYNSLNSALQRLWLVCIWWQGKKKNLELRVSSVKSGLIGHTSYVHSIIVHFSSGGETSPQSVVPKHSASRSQWAHIFHRAEAWGVLETESRTMAAAAPRKTPVFCPLSTHNLTTQLWTSELYCFVQLWSKWS